MKRTHAMALVGFLGVALSCGWKLLSYSKDVELVSAAVPSSGPFEESQADVVVSRSMDNDHRRMAEASESNAQLLTKSALPTTRHLTAPLRVHVRTDSGAIVPNATVNVRHHGIALNSGVTNTDGLAVVDFPEVGYGSVVEMEVSAEGFAPLVQQVAVAPWREAGHDVVLTIAETVGVIVKLIDAESGRGLPGERVTVRCAQARMRMARNENLQTDSSGVARTRVASGASFVVLAAPEGYVGVLQRVSGRTAGSAEASIDLMLSKGAYRGGVIVGETGEPVVSASIDLLKGYAGQMKSAADGTFGFMSDTTTAMVRATHPDYLDAQFTVDWAAAKDNVRLEMKRLEVVNAQIQDYSLLAGGSAPALVSLAPGMSSSRQEELAQWEGAGWSAKPMYLNGGVVSDLDEAGRFVFRTPWRLESHDVLRIFREGPKPMRAYAALHQCHWDMDGTLRVPFELFTVVHGTLQCADGPCAGKVVWRWRDELLQREDAGGLRVDANGHFVGVFSRAGSLELQGQPAGCVVAKGSTVETQLDLRGARQEVDLFVADEWERVDIQVIGRNGEPADVARVYVQPEPNGDTSWFVCGADGVLQVLLQPGQAYAMRAFSGDASSARHVHRCGHRGSSHVVLPLQ